MKLYYKARYFYFNQGQGKYTLEYMFGQQRPDYDYVDINSFVIPEDKYIIPGKYLLIIDIPDDKVDSIRYDLENFYKPMFNLAELTVEQAINFVKSNTVLEEVEPNKFLISPASNMLGVDYPETYLDFN